VYIEQYDGFDIFISNGTEAKDMTNTTQVNATARNFTIPPTGKFFVNIKAASSA